MGDGRTREVQGEDTKSSTPLQTEAYQPPVGRARYGGLAPAVTGMGGDKPATSDPFFKPPVEAPPQRNQGQQPAGRDPYMEPPKDQLPGRASPYLKPDGVPGSNQPGGDVHPDNGQAPVWKPKITQDWNSPQPGANGVPGSTQAMDDARNAQTDLLGKSRKTQYGSILGHALAAGTFSTAVEPVSKGAGLLAEKVSTSATLGEGKLGSAARWYQQGFDPLKMHSAQLAKESQGLKASLAELQGIANLDKAVLDKLAAGGSTSLTAEELTHANGLKKTLGLADDAALQTKLLERTQKLKALELAEMSAGDTKALLDRLKTLEINGGGKMFTPKEVQVLEGRVAQLQKTENLMALNSSAPDRTRWLSGKGAFNNFKTGAFGSLTSFGLVEGNRALKNQMMGSDFRSWESDAILVPTAVAASFGRSEATLLNAAAKEPGLLGKMGKATLYAGGAMALGYALDAYGPKVPEWMPLHDAMSRTTIFDGISVGVAMTVPVKDIRYRAGLVAVSAIGGNVLDALMTPEDPGSLGNQAVTELKEDKVERTYDSMNEAVAKFKELGDRRPQLLDEALSLSISNARRNIGQMNDAQRLDMHREIGILSRAQGEDRLGKGVRLNIGSTNSPQYLMEGLNLDMGGRALTYLRASSNNLKAARDLTSDKLMGKSVNGTKVDEQEVRDLDRSYDEVNGQINAILGKHDLGEAKKQLKRFLDKGTTSGDAILNNALAYRNTFYIEFNEALGRQYPNLRDSTGAFNPKANPEATELVAKILRDQSLAYIAEAEFILEKGEDPIKAAQILNGTSDGRNQLLPGTNIPRGYDGAAGAYLLAEALAPHNPDLPELKAMIERLTKEAENKIPGQYDDPRKNPLSVDRK